MHQLKYPIYLTRSLDDAKDYVNARFAEDQDPLDVDVPCPASTDYSKAYLHHLVRADEVLGKVLVSWHNIAFFQALTAAMREAT